MAQTMSFSDFNELFRDDLIALIDNVPLDHPEMRAAMARSVAVMRSEIFSNQNGGK